MEWISVKDRLPNQLPDVYYSEACLFIDINKQMFAGTYLRTPEKKYWEEHSNSCGCCFHPPTVTHWMPLPDPPVEEDCSPRRDGQA